VTIHAKRPPKSAKQSKATPWRGSDPVPKDTWRYNVLENDDIVQDVKTMLVLLLFVFYCLVYI